MVALQEGTYDITLFSLLTGCEFSVARSFRWEVVDGFPYGAVYVGLDSVLRDFFGRLFTGLIMLFLVLSSISPAILEPRHRRKAPLLYPYDRQEPQRR